MKRAAVAAMLIFALLSVTVFSGIASSVETYTSTFEILDEQKEDITLLLASASSASALISMIPDDAGTPIANELAELSGYFLLAMSVLYLEKFLLTTFGYIVFGWVIPVSMGLLIWHVFSPGKTWLRPLALRLLAFSMVLMLVIPVSAQICDRIEETHYSSIQKTIEMAVNSDMSTEEEAQDKSFWNKIGDAVEGLVDGAEEAINWAKTILNRFVEAVAVMLITSCVIPLAVLLCLIKVVKLLFGIDGSSHRALPKDDMQ